jgi:hypothetical protein
MAGGLQPRLQGIAAGVIRQGAGVRHREQGDGEAHGKRGEAPAILSGKLAADWYPTAAADACVPA